MTRPSREAMRQTDLSARWLRARARNVVRRPVPLLLVSGAAFLLAVAGLLVLQQRAPAATPAVEQEVIERPDTMPPALAVLEARQSIDSVQARLRAARDTLLQPPPPPPPAPVDTFPPEAVARRDSLAAMVRELSRLIERVQSSPLAGSYRSLGQSDALRGDPRAAALLDTLNVLESERERSGGLGVDPAFITLTARIGNVGRALLDIAEQRRGALRREVAALTPPRPPPPPPRPAIDTMPMVSALDSVRTEHEKAVRELAAARDSLADFDRRAMQRRAAARMAVSAEALIAAAVVLALALAFAASFLSELIRPRVADAREAERIAGAPVLAVIRSSDSPVEMRRRRSDQAAPDFLDVASRDYTELFVSSGMAGSIGSMVVVSGPHPDINVAVGANLAAACVQEARSALLVDADDSTGGVAGAFGVSGAPGLAEVASRDSELTEVIRPVAVGRDDTIWLVPCGRVAPGGYAPEAASRVRSELDRISRRYDMTIVVAGLHQLSRGEKVLVSPCDVILCSHVGRTPTEQLERAVKTVRESGNRLRGMVLWDQDPPPLPGNNPIAPATDAELAAGTADVDAGSATAGR